MAIWVLKGAIHRILAALPYGHRMNELLQTHVTRSLDLTQNRFENKLRDCATHLRHYAESTQTDEPPKSVLELGSGWYPVTPLGMFLSGADEIRTCDIAPLLRPHRVRTAMRRILEYWDRGVLTEYWPHVRADRMRKLRQVSDDPKPRSVSDLLGSLGITVLVCDARQLPLATRSVDLITSYGVLMHIETTALAGVLREFRRVVRPQGAMSHWIDLCDLYYWADSSISPLNFLRFSDRAWRLLQDPLVPANRLRVSDYRRMFAEAGFELTEQSNRRGEQKDLDRVPIAPRFARYERDELLVLDTWLAARPNSMGEGELQSDASFVAAARGES